MKALGEHIDKYRILWHHSSSALYERYIVERATDPGTSYVLQKWKTVHFTGSQDYTHFLSQMNRLRDMHQPLILPVEDFGTDTDDYPYVLLSSEAARMETLAERLQRSSPDEDETEAILTGVSAALVLAHQHDLVHGFFSPESVFLTPGNKVCISAFPGFAWDLNVERDSFPTQYRYPESRASRLSDQYALAGLVQELLLGQDKLPRDAAILRRAIARAQAQEPTQRFASIREFIGQIGIPLDIPEDEEELEPLMLPSSGSQQVRSAGAGKMGKRPAVPKKKRESNPHRIRNLFIFGPTLLLSALYIWTASLYGGYFHSTVNNGEKWTLAATPGEEISVSINAGVDSIKGNWASAQGIWLHLQGIPKPFLITPSQPNTWGSAILLGKYDSTQQALTINGDFTLPHVLAGSQQRVLHGTISGDVFFPEDTAMGFVDTHATITIPISIETVQFINSPWFFSKVLLYTMAIIQMLWFVFMPRVLGSFGDDGAFLRPLQEARHYYMDVRVLLWAIILCYGGVFMVSLVVASAVFDGSSTVSAMGEIYGLGIGQILVAIGSFLVTAIFKRKRALASGEAELSL